MTANNRYSFIVEWLDPGSQVLWKYQLFYYAETGEVEMFDIKNKRIFLKKTRCDTVSADRLFLGNVVTVFTRQLKVIEYGDAATENAYSSRSERTLAMIKPDAVQHVGKILDAIAGAGLKICRLRMCHLSPAECKRFYGVHEGKPFFDTLVSYISSGRIVAMELMGAGAIKKWRDLLGPTDSNQARAEAPNSLRARFGTDKTRNACHGSDAPETAAEECAFFFQSSPKVGPCAVGRGTTLCVVKPHAVESGLTGRILDDISTYFDITALEMMAVDRTVAAEFLEVYRGVIPQGDFNGMIDCLTAGPLVAVEVASHDGKEAVESFRELAGPMDPELARVLRPQSLRAKYGVNKVHSAVHCTDLVEDGDLEVEYFFTLLQ